ncbi:MAG: hypothetical protein U9N33_07285 [Campylobacterota bacterium]|nr:hypothetical protein [Campylobacterota bacterium]
MSEGFEKLKDIGAQKIHEQTHIVRQHAQAILHESFDDMSRIQFFGFLSILEREYSVDLSELRLKGEEFYGSSANAEEHSKVFVIPKKKKSYKLLYTIIILSIFLVAIFFTLDLASSKALKEKSYMIDNSVIENIQDTILDNIAKNPVEDSNVTSIVVEDEIEETEDTNATLIVIEEETDEALMPEESFKIIPKTKLWLGYIDLNTHAKRQITSSKEISLDPQKEWLLVFGHTNVEIEIDGELVDLESVTKVRYLYKDAMLRNISMDEFKKLNRGQKW